ncbi:synaptosomal-associated protein 23.2 isoform X1 [Danio rerio]|uniref:Synaptosomal-associated protein n=2 Tax=Danio rerio TaxID=7955 RepID=F1R892_DANRE|nr:synaptosomal-associated protein 23.2 [Danio rerio]|eukprot:NP_001032194.2 synaptosomal-associated protein 23-like [Danio rerio]
MSEEQITIKANHVTNASLESTRRIAQMTEECLNMGAETMTMLDEQGEKLHNVKRELGHINQDIKQAQANLNKLSSWTWKSFCSRLKPTKRESTSKQASKPKERQNVASCHPAAVQKGQAVSAESTAPSGPYITRITNDERENEMEDNLTKLGHCIKIIRDQTLEINNKLDEQNKTIQDIQNDVDQANDDVATANKQAKKC